MTRTPWWNDAVIYQIYPRSFADGNGDGIGDLAGIRSRIGYLRDLGVDGVWLSPFYPSPLADGGYDVADPRDVDPRIGSLADFDALVAELHAAGIRLVVDLVPNHTSVEHRWFRAALDAPKGSPERARYHFVDGRGPDGGRPPNNWVSLFGGPAWHPAGDGQWYLHIFAAEQPDLNWDNPQVRAEYLDVLRFWLDRGVDGIRVDAAQYLVKDLTDLQVAVDLHTDTRRARILSDRDELRQIYGEWGAVMRGYDPPRFGVAEVDVLLERRPLYAADLGQAFNFDLQYADWTLESVTEAINGGLADLAASGSTTWLLGCHDVPRAASRYGFDPALGWSHRVAADWLAADGATPPNDVELGRRRERAALLVALALPGAAYIYQGDELGLPEVADLPRHVLQDPAAANSGYTRKGRDGCRVPLPWTPTGPGLGFSTTAPHLPQPEWFARYAIGTQAGEPDSTLNLTRAAIGLRHRIDPGTPLVWQGGPADALRFSRGTLHVVAGFDTAVPVSGQVLLSSAPVVDGMLPPNAAVWLHA